MTRPMLVGTRIAICTVFVVSIALGIAVYIGGGEARSASTPRVEAAVQAAVAIVSVANANVSDSFAGRFEAVENVDVRARVSGAIRSIHFEEGGLVNRGDLLVEIDPEPYQAEVDRAAAQVASAEARLSYASRERDRAQQLIRTQAIAERERDQRVHEAQDADAALRMARAALRIAQLNLEYTRVRAPIAGRVGRREITVGNLVDAGPNAPVLTTILSVDPIYASFEADDGFVLRALRDIGGDRSRLSAIPVRVDLGDAHDPISGDLQFLDNHIDNRAGTIRLRASFANPNGNLMPGQFARIRVGRAREEPLILIPEQAIGTNQSRRFVLVINENNRATYREVSLGQSVEGMRVVTSGLSNGEKIVVNNLQQVRAGTLVEPQLGGTGTAASEG